MIELDEGPATEQDESLVLRADEGGYFDEERETYLRNLEYSLAEARGIAGAWQKIEALGARSQPAASEPSLVGTRGQVQKPRPRADGLAAGDEGRTLTPEEVWEVIRRADEGGYFEVLARAYGETEPRSLAEAVAYRDLRDAAKRLVGGLPIEKTCESWGVIVSVNTRFGSIGIVVDDSAWEDHKKRGNWAAEAPSEFDLPERGSENGSEERR